MKDYFIKNKDVIYVTVSIFIFAIMLIYWTDRFFTAKKLSYEQYASDVQNRVEMASRYAVQASRAASSVNNLDTGLITYLQRLSKNLDLEDRIPGITPMPGTSSIDHVSLRITDITIEEFTNFIYELELYDNVEIKALTMTKRYDNPKRVDIMVEVLKRN